MNLTFPKMMRYITSVFRQRQEQAVYRFYIAECLRIMTDNTARSAGGHTMTAKYSDIIDPKPVETKKAEDIVVDIFTRAGIGIEERGVEA